MERPQGTRPRVIIIGAGFVGLNAAKQLKNAPVDVLLIDQNNYHTFQPLLYQVATAALEPTDIAYQVRGVFRRQKNFRFMQGKVTGIDWNVQDVLLESGAAVHYDYLILGAGAVYTDFGTPGVKEHGFLLKTLEQANNLRSHILQQFELASIHPELIDEGILNFVIVGGGPTGIEMAGALLELFDIVLPGDYPEVDMKKVKVILLESSDEVLTPYTPRSRTYAVEVLRRRGADIRLNSRVSGADENQVMLKDGHTIPTKTLIWAAGVRASPLVDVLGLELDRGFRVKVNEDLSVPGKVNAEGKPNVFVAGDMSGAKDNKGMFYPQVAPVAIQQGQHVGRTIKALETGHTTKPFSYFDKGTMAIIGRNSGIAELSPVFGGLKLRGFLGWLGWLFIHLVYLPGHQNRFNAFTNWTYNYFTYDRHVRLINYMAEKKAVRESAEGAPANPGQVEVEPVGGSD
jgi:NADH:ubiquinone reductase (H+-translocating)